MRGRGEISLRGLSEHRGGVGAEVLGHCFCFEIFRKGLKFYLCGETLREILKTCKVSP